MLQTLEERLGRFQRAREVITDAARVAFVFVVIPERLPIVETGHAVAVLNRHRIPIGAVIVNRVLPPDATGDFLGRRREREAVHLASIADRFREYPLYYVPLFETDVYGMEALRRTMAAMSEAA